MPPGYRVTPFLPWGTPILGAFPAFRPGANTAAEQEQQVGMDDDGMHFFPVSGSTRGLLVVNHEDTDERLLHTGSQRGTRPSRADPPCRDATLAPRRSAWPTCTGVHR